MADTFDERIRHLMTAVGDGGLVMNAVVQQPYAAAQHQRSHEGHHYGPPSNGMEDYLEKPFLASIPQYMQILAFNAVTRDGSNLEDAAIQNADHMAGLVRRNAPKASGLLSESADAIVYSNGRTVYHNEQNGPYNWEKH